MTVLADSELRRNKILSCASWIQTHRPPVSTFHLQLEELPVWNMCSFQFNGIRLKEVWIDCDPMTVALQCTNVDNRSMLVLTILHAGSVGRTTEYVNPFFCSNLD